MASQNVKMFGSFEFQGRRYEPTTCKICAPRSGDGVSAMGMNVVVRKWWQAWR
jgi:hypothetical protein